MHQSIYQNVVTSSDSKAVLFAPIMRTYINFENAIREFFNQHSNIKCVHTSGWEYVELSNDGKFKSPKGIGTVVMFDTSITMRNAGLAVSLYAYYLYSQHAEHRGDVLTMWMCDYQTKKLEEYLPFCGDESSVLKVLNHLKTKRPSL